MNIQGYVTDPVLVKCGRPQVNGKNKDGSLRTFWVRPFGTAYDARISALRKSAGERLCQRDADLDRECQIRALADVVLCRKDPNTGLELPSWENFQNDDGTDFPPTTENKCYLLRGGPRDGDPETFVRQFFVDVVNAAGEIQAFVVEEKESAEKNSLSSLTTS